MSVVTTPKQKAAKDEPRMITEVVMTQPQKLALQKARKNLAQGKSLTPHELKRKLGIKG